MGRSPCCAKEGLNRGAWTAIEDKILADYIKVHGEGRWRNLPKKAGLKRCGKSCRLRWLNYLRPDIKRGNITRDEEELIIRLHKLLGNRWSLIAGRLPGRTDNEIKNYWNTNLGKKIQENRSSPPNPKISSKQSNESLNRRTPSKTERQLVRTKAVRCTKAVLSSLTQKVEQVQCAPTNIEPAKQEEELFDSGFPHLLTSEDLIMDDFCMGDLSLSDLLNSDLSDLCDFSCSNDNSGDLSPHSEKEQQLILSGRVMEDWDLSDTGKNNVASDLHSFSSLLESEGDWL